MIEKFTTQEFEEALPENAQYFGIEAGERVYIVRVTEFCLMKIRSSIDNMTNVARSTGQDSIRIWLEISREDGTVYHNKQSKDLGTYTTREPGWDRRLGEKIEHLTKLGLKIKRPIKICSKCNRPHFFYVSHSAKNPDRPFCKCPSHNEFTWLDEPMTEQTPNSGESNGSMLDGDDGDDFLSQVAQIVDAVSPEYEDEKRIQLNPQQQSVVDASVEGSFRVMAGPGSGKTATAQERILRLFAEGARPGEILYMVFNKTMADEGAKRIIGTLKKHGIPAVDAIQASRWFCTIHAASLRMLTADGDRYEVEKEWRVKKMIEELSETLWPFGPDDLQHPRPPWHEILSMINTAKMNCIDAGDDELFYEEITSPYHAQRLTSLRKVMDSRMSAQRKITFADMPYLVEKKLKEEQAFREKWQGQFKWVLIDEGQDTNAQAMRIARILSKPQGNFGIIGDTDQMMYRFTGATPEENLLGGFSERYPDGEMFMLETNYRSTRKVIQATNNLIAFNYAGKGGPYSEAYHKFLEPGPDAEQGDDVSFTEYDGPGEEALSITQSIKDKIDSGASPGDFFIGARTKAQGAYFEQPMMLLGVPFINLNGGSFWDLRHVKIVVDYLRLVYESDNAAALRTVYRVASNDFVAQWGNKEGQYTPTRYLGEAFLAKARGGYADVEREVEDYEYNGSYVFNKRGWTGGAVDLVEMVREIQFRGCHVEQLRYIIDGSVKKHLIQEMGTVEENDSRIDDLEAVVDIAGRFETAEEFLKYVDEAQQAAKDKKDRNWDDYVVISTIHKLKGLEREIVYGPGWSEGIQIGPDGVEQPIGLLPHTFSLMPPPAAVLYENGQSLVEDERCIAFVLASRAKKELHISSVRAWRKAIMSPSRFVYEMLPDLEV